MKASKLLNTVPDSIDSTNMYMAIKHQLKTNNWLYKDDACSVFQQTRGAERLAMQKQTVSYVNISFSTTLQSDNFSDQSVSHLINSSPHKRNFTTYMLEQ